MYKHKNLIIYGGKTQLAIRNLFFTGAKRVLYIFFGVILFRMFILDFRQVQSNSMEETLFSGDFIVVNKFRYGTRLPLTIRQVPFAEAITYILGLHKWAKNINWSYRRMPGTTAVKHGDIIIFDRISSDKTLVKRCIGLPGDTVDFSNDICFINDKLYNEPPTTKLSYNIKLKHIVSIKDFQNAAGLLTKDYLGMRGRYLRFSMTRKTAIELEKNYLVDAVFYDAGPSDVSPLPTYTAKQLKPVLKRIFPPIVVPRKGKVIPLTPGNVSIYRQAIMRDEHNELITKGDSVFLNGKLAFTYRFKMNYYFVVGDNRYHSFDSRHWGFVAENCIVGKVSAVLFSINKEKPGFEKLRSGRLFNFSDFN